MSVATAAAIVSLSEAQAFVRVENGDEEALLAGLIRTASALCESFLNQVVIARPFSERLKGTGGWQRLSSQPVRSITSALSGGQPLPGEQYGLDIDHDGVGWVRLPAGLTCVVSGTAGLAAEENEVPEPVRQGVLRLAAHLYSNRDGGGEEPPAIVTALWRPFRRVVLA